MFYCLTATPVWQGHDTNGGIFMKAFIYDMDGVIADTEPVHMQAEQYVMKKMGVELEVSYFQRYQGMTDIMIYRGPAEAVRRQAGSREAREGQGLSVQ